MRRRMPILGCHVVGLSGRSRSFQVEVSGRHYAGRDASGRPSPSSPLISHLCRYARARGIPCRPAAQSGSRRPSAPGCVSGVDDSRDLYFQGMAWFNKGLGPDTLSRARNFFERALALDPGNLDAELGTAQVDAQLGNSYLTDDPRGHCTAAEAILAKVLSLAPNNAWAHYWLELSFKFPPNRAVQVHRRMCERALALPDQTWPVLTHGWAWARFSAAALMKPSPHVKEALRLFLLGTTSPLSGWDDRRRRQNCTFAPIEEAVTWLGSLNLRAIEIGRSPICLSRRRLGKIWGQARGGEGGDPGRARCL